MTLLSKMQTLFRANVREATEKVTDANAIRIYRQEIVDAQNLLARRKLGLAALIAGRKDIETEITSVKARAKRYEDEIQKLANQERSEDLLLLAANDIATQLALVEELNQRHLEVSRRISVEEVTLRKLKNAIREHAREVKVLEAQRMTTHLAASNQYQNTVAAQLETLRDTRASILTTVSAMDTSEASMEEMIERIEESPFERKIKSSGKTDRELMIASVLARLRSSGKPA